MNERRNEAAGGRWRMRMMLLFVVVAVLVVPVHAGKDRLTQFPTQSSAPSIPPTVSPVPSLFPTDYPSQAPSHGPTVPPQPSFIRTTTNPSSAPVVPTVIVAMPKLAFVMDKAKNATTGIIQNTEIGEALESFLSDYLATGTHKNSFRSLNLVTTLVQDDAMVTLTIKRGSALYETGKEPVPTVEGLATILTTYFSFWGDLNLNKYFVTKGFPIENVSEVQLDGKALPSQGNLDAEKAIPTPNSISQENDQSSESFNNYVIAGIVVGGVVLIVAGALFVRARKGQNELLGKNSREGVIVIDSIEDPETADMKGEVETKPTEESNADECEPGGERVGADPHLSNEMDASSDADEVLARASNSPLKYPGVQLPLHIRPYSNKKDDESSSEGESDGDIISVTESLLYKDNPQGPLYNVMPHSGALDGAATGPDDLVRQLAMTGKASVRAPPPPSFQYDASRLDQVISSAKGNQND